MELLSALWPDIFYLFIGVGLLVFIALASLDRRNLALALVVLIFSIVLFQYVQYWKQHTFYFPLLTFFPTLSAFLIGPLLLFYVKNFSYSTGKRMKPMVLLGHLVPSIIVLGLILIFWSVQWGGVTRATANVVLRFFSNPVPECIALSIYGIWIHRIANRQTQGNEKQRVARRWLFTIVYLFWLYIAALVSYYILVRFPFFNNAWDYSISIAMCLAIYLIGFLGYRTPEIFNGELLAALYLPAPPKAEHKQDEQIDSSIYETILEYMAREKPYLDGELRLVVLADKVGVSSHLLSKVINEKSGKNFNQFINDFRLTDAEDLLKKSSAESIKEIYYGVGFNNKASFYKAFKDKYQCTPSEFRKAARVGA